MLVSASNGRPGSLGAYPDQAYYDPQRPAWMPYWLDTPTESAMWLKLYGGANVNTQYAPPKGPPPPSAPQTEAQMRTWSIEDLIAANAAGWKAWYKDAIPELPATATDTGSHNWLLIALAVAAIAGLILVTRR